MATKLARHKRVALRLQFSDVERRDIELAARAVWDEVGWDVITQGTGDEAQAKNIRRLHVIEIVCDAGRLEARITDKQLRARVRSLDYDLLIALLTPAFPYAWYGL